MPSPVVRRAAIGVAVTLTAAGLVLIGRATVRSAPDLSGYTAGLQQGMAEGREEGRALQAGAEVPADALQPVRDAFTAGYAAGTEDVFTGYDGGWAIGRPYVVTLARAPSPVTYRIDSRTPMQSGIAYFLCPDGQTLCQSARR